MTVDTKREGRRRANRQLSGDGEQTVDTKTEGEEEGMSTVCSFQACQDVCRIGEPELTEGIAEFAKLVCSGRFAP